MLRTGAGGWEQVQGSSVPWLFRSGDDSGSQVGMVLVAMAPGQFLGMFCRESRQDWVSSVRGSVRSGVHCLWPWPLYGGAHKRGALCTGVREGRSGLSSVGHLVQFLGQPFASLSRLAAGPRSSISVGVWSGMQKPL